MSDNQPPKDGGSTDELPTLPGPAPKDASPTRVDAAPPARPDAVSIEPVTQKKPSGTVIIQDRAKPPAGTQMADPLAATLPVGSPVGPTLPGDPQRRAQATVLEANAGSPATLTPGAGLPGAIAPPRAANASGSGSMIVWAIAGGALAIGVVIGAVLYLTRASGDDDAAPEPTIALHDAGATAKPTTPTQTAPVPPPVTPPTTPATDPVATQPKPTPPGTTHPTPTTSSSAPPPDADNNTLPRFPTSFPTAMPTAFPTVLPTAFPSSWPMPG